MVTVEVFSVQIEWRAKDNGTIIHRNCSILWALDGLLRRSLQTLPPLTIVFLEHLGSVKVKGDE